MKPVARRIALAPARAAKEDAIAEAALGVPAALDAATLRLGDEVATEPVAFLVMETEPRGEVRVDLDVTRVEIAPTPPPERHLVYDVLVLVDASWTMGKEDVEPSRFDAARAAVAGFVRNAGDLARNLGVGTFNREPAILAPLAPGEDLDPRALEGVRPRGRGDVVAAVTEGAQVLRTEGGRLHRSALLLATDGPNPGAVLPAAVARAARLGVRIFVLDVGPSPSRILEKAAAVTRGAYHHAPAAPSFEFAARAIAEDLGAPLDWDDAVAGAGENTEFEILLRAGRPGAPDPVERRRKSSP